MPRERGQMSGADAPVMTGDSMRLLVQPADGDLSYIAAHDTPYDRDKQCASVDRLRPARVRPRTPATVRSRFVAHDHSAISARAATP